MKRRLTIAVALIATQACAEDVYSARAVPDCLPPIRPLLPASDDLRRDYRTELGGELSEYFDLAGDYLRCLETARAVIQDEIDAAIADYEVLRKEEGVMIRKLASVPENRCRESNHVPTNGHMATERSEERRGGAWRRLHLLLAASAIAILPKTAPAYQIDCAILLCLSGGWPVSEPCAAAKLEFMRRVTPWPVEPPLQIWRCPLGAAHRDDGSPEAFDWLLEASAEGLLVPSSPDRRGSEMPAVRPIGMRDLDGVPAVTEPTLAQSVSPGADVDISDPVFDFVRSIRVFHVSSARQSQNDDGDCNRHASVRVGRYGMQGEFSWSTSSPFALPAAHSGMEGYGRHCPPIWSHRSVFVDWRDYEGTYGFEQVNY